MIKPIFCHISALILFSSTSLMAQDSTWTPSVETTKVTDAVYILRVQDNPRGGYDNSVVSVGEDGILLVDHSGTWGAVEVREEIQTIMLHEMKRLSAQDSIPEYVITTHWHGDHSSGTLLYGEQAVSISHENTYQSLKEGQNRAWLDQTYGPFEEEQLPDITFTDSLTLRLNDQTIKLYHFGHSHTTGDAIVYFQEAGVIHMSDLFQGHHQMPLAEFTAGLGYTYSELIKRIPKVRRANIRIVTGHAETQGFEALQNHARLFTEVTEWIRSQLEEGKLPEEIMAADLPGSWETDWKVNASSKMRLKESLLESIEWSGIEDK